MPHDPNLQLLRRPSREQLYEEALIEAEALRRQAIDDFWRGANATLATGATNALRAAGRLAARLRRQRSVTPASRAT